MTKKQSLIRVSVHKTTAGFTSIVKVINSSANATNISVNTALNITALQNN
jgi:hypothetical protein